MTKPPATALMWLVGGVAFIALLIFVAAEGPYWFKDTSSAIKSKGQERWWSQEIQGNRTAILAMIGGSLAAFGGYVTWQGMRITRRGHQTDRFAKALELLADERPAVRIGGVYALSAVARESPLEVQAVVNVLEQHAKSGDGASSEADRAVAADNASKLDPAEARRQVLGVDDLKSALAAIVALAFATSLLTGDFTELPTSTELVGLVGAAAAIGVAWWQGRRETQKAELELQRPLFAIDQALVFEGPDGRWTVGSSLGPDIVPYDSQEQAVAAARALLTPQGGELRILKTSRFAESERSITIPKGADDA